MKIHLVVRWIFLIYSISKKLGPFRAPKNQKSGPKNVLKLVFNYFFCSSRSKKIFYTLVFQKQIWYLDKKVSLGPFRAFFLTCDFYEKWLFDHLLVWTLFQRMYFHLIQLFPRFRDHFDAIRSLWDGKSRDFGLFLTPGRGGGYLLGRPLWSNSG